ncbi:PBP1A family penicillin-binding protein [Candidatus Sumerlaeota bacterium]|nr:PBP1A family penicillin-binding protein [Candidatus Sumerlaeota bacterium]
MQESPNKPPTKTNPPRQRRRRRRQRWYLFFLVAVTIGTLGASLAVGVLMGYVNSLPPIEKLEDYNPQQATVVLDRSGARTVGEFAEERRHVVHIQEIPEMLKKAFLAIEDDRFEQHFGVDLMAIVRSAVANLKSGGNAQGASTITMQLPRNIMPEEYTREKKLERKIKEAILAFQIERRYSKDQILEFYLNHIDMGRQAFGIYTAAQTYFDKEPKDLTLAECAMLAAIPKGPSMYNPLGAHNQERARRRRDAVLRRMYELGWISEEQYDRAKNTPVTTRPGKRRSNVATSEYPYFVDALQRDLTGYYQMDEKNLRQDGMTIRSTIDPRIQRIVQEELKAGLVAAERMWEEKKIGRLHTESGDLPAMPEAGQTRIMKIAAVPTTGTAEVSFNGYTGSVEFPAGDLPYYEPQNVLKPGGLLDVRVTGVDSKKQRMELKPADTVRLQGSAVVMDAKSAEVFALVGGDDFFDTANNGQFNRAFMGGKPAGSTVKPFFYAAALERGWLPHDIIVDEPITIPSVPAPYKPRNYEKEFFGPTTLIEALEHSRNVATVRMFLKLGIKKTLKQVDQFDFRPGDSVWRDKFRAEVPVCLGTVDMSAIEIAAAYQTFANQGIERMPIFFQSIAAKDGRKLRDPDPGETIVLDPAVAYQMLYILRQVVVGGTGKMAIGDKFPSPPYPPICGKTGTTDDSTDAWFVGMTPELIICVYIGFDTPRSMGPQMTGGKVAGPIWASIFARVFATRDNWKMAYDAPADIETADICGETGKRVSELCGRAGHHIYRAVPYKRGTAPPEKCDGAVRSPMVARSGTSYQAPESAETPEVDGGVLESIGDQPPN